MQSVTTRRDPDFICSWCVKRAGGHLIDAAAQPDQHDAFCRYCCSHTAVAERSNYAFPEEQEPRPGISGFAVAKQPGLMHKQICWPCVRQAGGWRRGWAHWTPQARCSFCGESRRTTDVLNFTYTRMPAVSWQDSKGQNHGE